jgi:hypothetical protein
MSDEREIEARREARRIIDRRCEPGVTVATGWLSLSEQPLYEPDRLFRFVGADGVSYLIEWAFMTVDLHAEAAVSPFELVQLEHHRKWAASELAKGRDPRELTWSACVVESGIFMPFSRQKPKLGVIQ